MSRNACICCPTPSKDVGCLSLTSSSRYVIGVEVESDDVEFAMRRPPSRYIGLPAKAKLYVMCIHGWQKRAEKESNFLSRLPTSNVLTEIGGKSGKYTMKKGEIKYVFALFFSYDQQKFLAITYHPYLLALYSTGWACRSGTIFCWRIFTLLRIC